MDQRAELIKAFYRGLPLDRVKLETQRHGFPFLGELLADGAELDYGELTLSGILHKYKLSKVPAQLIDRLIDAHVKKEGNVCLYFGAESNSLFCFNLDNNHKENNTVVIPEMELAVRSLREKLTAAGCEPLVIASGRGFHLWCRLDGPVANERLYQFMLAAAIRVAAELEAQGRDHRKVKFNFYPDPRTQNTVSLRLFGSDHAKNRVFSRILTDDGVLLDENASWAYFENYLQTRTVTVEAFGGARCPYRAGHNPCAGLNAVRPSALGTARATYGIAAKSAGSSR